MFHSSPNTTAPRQAFTLVELLVTIAIISILMAIAIPAITGALRSATQTSQKLELDTLSRSIEQYLQKYGDYPPDGSSKAILERHMRKVFPRMLPEEITLLNLLTDNSMTGLAGTEYGPAAMDRGEALVFFLGGFSSDVQRPLTGAGGPLEFKGYVDTDKSKILNYQYNSTRDNFLFDFDSSRLSIARASDTDPMLSTDETRLGHSDAAHGGADLLPVYFATGNNPTPIVYFDSRTYGLVTNKLISSTGSDSFYNGYTTGNANYGGVRPYKTELNPLPPSVTNYASEAEAFAAYRFHNPNAFQIVSPGSDGVFGAIVSITAGNPAATPVHFVTESGRAVVPYSGSSYTSPSQLFFSTPAIKGYQDSDWVSDITVSGNLDNITNFSTSTLESDLQ